MAKEVVEKIKENPNNPRYIEEAKFKKLVKSVKEAPWMLELRPLVVDKDNVVLGGNMRLKAIQELGIKEVTVLRAEELTEEQKKEFVIKDNLGYGKRNRDDIANEWDAELLSEWGMDVPEDFLEEPEDDPEKENAIPETPENIIVEEGDIFQLGEHRLMCGDSTNIEAVEKLMDGEKADMVFTDPPYGMFLNADYSSMEGWHKGKKYDNVIGDHDDFNPDFITTCFTFGAKEVFLWGADYYSEHLPSRNEGSWIVWDKRVDESKDKMYGSGFELCWSMNRHQRRIVRKMRAGFMGDAEASKRVHPTQKPTELIKYIFDERCSGLNNVVDLFGGSGSTLIACEKTNRKCYMCELDPKYIQVILKRYHTYTEGKKEIKCLNREIDIEEIVK